MSGLFQLWARTCGFGWVVDRVTGYGGFMGVEACGMTTSGAASMSGGWHERVGFLSLTLGSLCRCEIRAVHSFFSHQPPPP